MRIRFKIYEKDGKISFAPCRHDNLIWALSDSIYVANKDKYDKIDIYFDDKKIITVYG